MTGDSVFVVDIAMPAKDIYHNSVKEALEKEGWVITHDPYFIRLGKRRGFIDLGAEMIGAERGSEKIAVEIKSFLGTSDVDEFRDALGQFLLYQEALNEKEIDRTLFLAMPDAFYNSLFDDLFFLKILHKFNLKILIYSPISNSVERWIS